MITKTNFAREYACNGVTTVFDITSGVGGIYFTDDDQIVLYYKDTDNNLTLISSGYTIVDAVITFETAPLNGLTLYIRRETDEIRSTDFEANRNIDAETLDDDADKAIAMIQELTARINRSLHLSLSSDEVAEIALTTGFLYFDANGVPSIVAGTTGTVVPGYGPAATLGNLVQRDPTTGRARIVDGVDPTDIVNKEQLDAEAATRLANDLDPESINNVGLTAVPTANALVLSLKQQDSSTNPAAGNGAVGGMFRSSTLTSGAYSKVITVAALSLTIPSTATMGHANAVPDKIHVYLGNNAGTLKLLVATEDLFDEKLLWTTTATPANSRSTLYSDAVYTNIAIRHIATIYITEATAGTWATAPTNIVMGKSKRDGVIKASLLKSAATSLTTATAKTIASISVPPGDFIIGGMVGFVPGATTSITDLFGAISKTDNTLPASDTQGVPTQGEVYLELGSAAMVAGGRNINIAIPGYEIKLAAQTTIYLVARGDFTVSTLTGYGSIEARRK
jgi:hypothetical protein